MNEIKVSIFTPTFNRAGKLERLYNSLKLQTYNNFTWLIVDDGSTDATKYKVEEWLKEDIIKINYCYQNNAGKQKAYNRAIELSDGDIFICIDSDDIYINTAIKTIVDEWESIEKKDEFIGVSYLSQSFEGRLIGSSFPKDITSGFHFDIHNSFNVYGDKGMAFNLTKLKKFRFPLYLGEKFTTEALLYNRMSIRYKTRYINECLEVKEYLEDGLSDKYQLLLIKNPHGAALYYKEFSYHRMKYKVALKSAINTIRYCIHADKLKISKLILSKNCLLNIIFLFAAYYLCFRDKIKYDL